MSHNSPRSLRIKQEARLRPDVLWYKNGELQHDNVKKTSSDPNVLSGGTDLAKLVTKADKHQLAMRQIVQ